MKAPPHLFRDRMLARYYDLEYQNYTDDIPFYVEYAKVLDPARALTVLELGCGTGRIALAMARAGFRVVCLDSSQGMLDLCSGHSGRQDLAVKVIPVAGDMRTLDSLPAEKYGLAYCALNTFAYLVTTEDQRLMLTNLRKIVQPNGTLLLDLTPPWPHLMPPSDGEMVHQGSWTFLDDYNSVVHKLITGHAEPATQTYRVTLFYDHEATTGVMSRISQELTLRWTGRYEMELLLESTGWALDALYGSYDLDEFGDDSERMIFVARPA